MPRTARLPGQLQFLFMSVNPIADKGNPLMPHMERTLIVQGRVFFSF